MATRALAALIVGTALLQTGCSNSPERMKGGQAGESREVLSVYVVNYPLKYFAGRIGGEHVRVEFPAPADEDPAFWRPDPATIAAYQEADLILLNGAAYAKWVDIVSLPGSKLHDTSASFGDRLIHLDGALTHSHGPGGEHAHGEIAFTTWLDPRLAIEQARAVCEAISQARPEDASTFKANLIGLENDLVELDAALERALAEWGDAPLVFSHPVYQYFERRYGLDGKSLHWEPDEMPSAEQWNELADLLKTHEAKVMVWEGEPLPEIASRLAEMGIRSVVFDPCGNTPAGTDYLGTMGENMSGLGGVMPSASGIEETSSKVYQRETQHLPGKEVASFTE